MRMWKIVMLHIGLCLIVVACTGPKFMLNEEAKGKLSRIPGQIGMRFAAQKKIWHYSIANGEMLLRSVMSTPPAYLEGKQFIYFRSEVPEGLPTIEGFDYYGPYGASPDKSHMILSISPKALGSVYPTDFVLIGEKTKEVIYQGKKNDTSYLIRDITWSPDSKLFAVLEESAQRRYGCIDMIAAMTGHYNEEATFYLSIYDLKGQLFVKSEVASGLINPGARILWEDKKE